MALTLVVVCGRCGGLLLARADQKTRKCPYCGADIVLEKTRKVASAEDAFKASEILKKLKSDMAQKPRRL